MPENLSVTDVFFAVTAVTVILAAFGVLYCHVAHDHNATVPEFTTCLVYLAAAKLLRRSHGRHRMEDLYELQPAIRSDWRQLTYKS